MSRCQQREAQAARRDSATQTDSPSCCAAVFGQLQAIEQELFRTRAKLRRALERRPVLTSVSVQTSDVQLCAAPSGDPQRARSVARKSAKGRPLPPRKFKKVSRKHVPTNFAESKTSAVSDISSTLQPEKGVSPAETDEKPEEEPLSTGGQGDSELPAEDSEVSRQSPPQPPDSTVRSGSAQGEPSPSDERDDSVADEDTAAQPGAARTLQGNGGLEPAGDGRAREDEPLHTLTTEEPPATDTLLDTDVKPGAEKQGLVIGNSPMKTDNYETETVTSLGGSAAESTSDGVGRISEVRSVEWIKEEMDCFDSTFAPEQIVECIEDDCDSRPATVSGDVSADNCSDFAPEDAGYRQSAREGRRCLLCPATFCSQRQLELHMTAQHFSAPPAPFQPVTVQVESKPYVCETCGEGFTQRSGLRVHERIHSTPVPDPLTTDRGDKGLEAPFSCHVCGKEFNTSANERRHYWNAHEKKLAAPWRGSPANAPAVGQPRPDGAQPSGPQTCSHCGKVCSTFFNLKRHFHAAHVRKPHVCEVCGMGFSQLSVFRRHCRCHRRKPAPVAAPHDSGAFQLADTQPAPPPPPLLQPAAIKLQPSNPRRCPVCNKLFCSQIIMQRHVREIHLNIRPHVCHVCGKGFAQIYKLRKHELTHKKQRFVVRPPQNPGTAQPLLEPATAQEPSVQPSPSQEGAEFQIHQCSHCNKIFASFQVLKRHLRETHQEDCSKFSSAASNQIALPQQTVNRIHRCPHCNRRFQAGWLVKRHIRVVHMNKGQFNAEGSAQNAYPQQTVTIKTEPKLFSSKVLPGHRCPFCSKKFTRDFHAQRHINMVHFGLKPYVCDDCGKSFSNSSQLRRHKLLFHDARPNPTTADVHGSFQANPTTANVHSSLEPDPTPMSSFQTNTLTANPHQSIPSASKFQPQTCTICGKRFKTLQYLNLHMSIHSEFNLAGAYSQGPQLSAALSCHICGQRFGSRQNLQRHACHRTVVKSEFPAAPVRATDSGDPFKPLGCSKCGKTFANMTRFRQHATWHAKLRLFPCEVCGQRFYDAYHLASHRQVHTREGVLV